VNFFFPSAKNLVETIVYSSPRYKTSHLVLFIVFKILSLILFLFHLQIDTKFPTRDFFPKFCQFRSSSVGSIQTTPFFGYYLILTTHFSNHSRFDVIPLLDTHFAILFSSSHISSFFPPFPLSPCPDETCRFPPCFMPLTCSCFCTFYATL